MACGDRVVIDRVSFPITLPVPLRMILESYKKDRGIVSLNATVKELLETHPEIDKRIKRLYALSQDDNTPSF
jgi:Zn-dependent protease with chaperone function